MDKKKALSRLDSLEHEAAELRKIIEGPDKVIFDNDALYVAVVDGSPYILTGVDNRFSWWGFKKGEFEHPIHNRYCDRGSAQDAIDRIAEDGEVFSFSDPVKGIRFFYTEYMKAHE